MFACESNSVQINFGYSLKRILKINILGNYLIHFILVRFSSGQLIEILSHLSFSLGFTDFFFPNIFIKVIFKTYGIYFEDKLIKFLVGSYSVQRLYSCLKCLLFA